ncbi:hypothetical protein CLV35_1353 [Motilibacter peucedani]|uniref:PRC-barrel domain protein n=1 Tax=Motilibacter peucedani TaxID=598650 RepID=A0A420XS83_9ACTN|nr:PRC-barrel domain containing protein [Motilibacter peucedani]RKS77659.1 hypothetical protein CLV35_1353 [Motilibacter peucedani]
MIDERALETGHVFDSRGKTVGAVLAVYRRAGGESPDWVAVGFDDGPRFVPLRTAEQVPDGVRVPFTTDTIVQAPVLDPDAGNLSAEDEAELYEHYGLDHPLPFEPTEGGPADASGAVL